MSEIEKTKKEMIHLLEMIPLSGSYKSAELALQVSELSRKMRTLASAPEPASAVSSEPHDAPTKGR